MNRYNPKSWNENKVIGFSTSRLSNGAIYYVAKVDNTSFSIASTKERAIKKTELIDFVLFGNNTHTFTSNRNRKIIDKIVINNQTPTISNIITRSRKIQFSKPNLQDSILLISWKKFPALYHLM